MAQNVPGVALCEACQFQQQQSQVHPNQIHNSHYPSISQCERWEAQVLPTNHEALGKFIYEIIFDKVKFQKEKDNHQMIISRER